jgi:hypothetical protein
MSDPPRRNRVLFALVGFVVAFGGAAWVVTGGFHAHDATARQVSTLKPPHCGRDLEVIGVFNECAEPMPDPTTVCSLSGRVLDARLRFVGTQVFGLDIEIDGIYGGKGPYDLMPWPDGLEVIDNSTKVGVEIYSSDTLWQSVAGVLTITTGDGRSGTVNAVLQTYSATDSEPGPTISVIGPWSCP